MQPINLAGCEHRLNYAQNAANERDVRFYDSLTQKLPSNIANACQWRVCGREPPATTDSRNPYSFTRH